MNLTSLLQRIFDELAYRLDVFFTALFEFFASLGIG